MTSVPDRWLAIEARSRSCVDSPLPTGGPEGPHYCNPGIVAGTGLSARSNIFVPVGAK